MRPSTKIIVLAANATVPALDGGSLRAVAFRDEFKGRGYNVVWLGRAETNVAGHEILRTSASKPIAALRSLISRRNYVLERCVGSDWRSAVKAAASASNEKDIVWANFVWSYPEWIRAGGKGRVFIDTHNSEREYFENQAEKTWNPLTRKVAAVSIDHAEYIVKMLPSTVTLVHVSEGDKLYYQKLAPHCAHVVVPNGCNMRPPAQLPRKPGLPRLYFLGSLGVNMNFDALKHFSREIWPHLKGQCVFEVFGSNPSKRVVHLAAFEGWPLNVNLTDAELDLRLVHFDAAVMPFPYSAGSKLKLVDALSRGMFVLSTAVALKGSGLLPGSVVAVETGAEWRKAVNSINFDDKRVRHDSISYARNVSWSSLIKKFLESSAFQLK